jgi:hypothetical protein
MDEYSRPATLEDLKALIRSLNDQGADYLLIGGYALFVHGYHRATTDIDVLVPATQESGRKVRDALMVLPDQAAKDLDPAWFDEGENIRVADAFVVDSRYSTSTGSSAIRRALVGGKLLLQSHPYAVISLCNFKQYMRVLCGHHQ